MNDELLYEMTLRSKKIYHRYFVILLGFLFIYLFFIWLNQSPSFSEDLHAVRTSLDVMWDFGPHV